MSGVKVLASGAALLVVGGAVLVVACVAVAEKSGNKDGVILAAHSSGVVESVRSQNESNEPVEASESADLFEVAAAPPQFDRGAGKPAFGQNTPEASTPSKPGAHQDEQSGASQFQSSEEPAFSPQSAQQTEPTGVPQEEPSPFDSTPAETEAEEKLPPTICLHVIPGKLILSQSAEQAATMAKQIPNGGLLVMCQGVTVESKIVEGEPTMSLKCQTVTIKGAQDFEAQADQLVVEGVPSLLKLSGSNETPVRLRRLLPGAAEPLGVSAETVSIDLQKWSVHATDSESAFECNFTIKPATVRNNFSARSVPSSNFSPF